MEQTEIAREQGAPAASILAEQAWEGKVRKVEVPDGSDRFDFTLENHYHVECVKCGGVFDVDMDVISELEKKIKDTHGIQYLSYDIFFKGICPECQKKEIKDV